MRHFTEWDDSSLRNWTVCTNTPSGHPKNPAGPRTGRCASASGKTAEREEAASTQAVKRGHQVTMIEVPDKDDDVSFQRWLATGSPMIFPKPRTTTLPTPLESPEIPTRPLPNEGVVPTCIRKDKVTSPTVAMPSTASAKVPEAPHQWLRPFKVDWMLHAIRKARNDNTACAALAVWIYRDKPAKMTNKLLTELRMGRVCQRVTL